MTKKTDDFLQWFVGFSEGDGSWIVVGNRNIFSINQKEKEILLFIKKTLKIGAVHSSKPIWQYKVGNQKEILLLMSIFESSLILDKTRSRFQRWFSKDPFYAKDYSLNKVNFKNYWLSGFIDAEGSFYCTVSKYGKDKCRLEFVFSISQTEKKIIDRIQYLIKGNSVRKKGNVYETSIKSIKIERYILLINYLQKYPLLSKKKESFRKWFNLLKSTEKFIYSSNDPVLSQLREYVKTIN